MDFSMSQSYFAQISPGLEEDLKVELKSFRVRKLKSLTGGYEFTGTRKHLYKTLIWSRFTSRIFQTLGSFSTPNPQALFQKVSKLNWNQILKPTEPLLLKVHFSRSSGFAGSGQVEEIIKKALQHQRPKALSPPFNWSTPFEMGQQRLLVHLDQHHCTLRLDASGFLMHRRGWRIEDGLAPLRPTLASTLLHQIGWTPDHPLVDPFCGSGTFLVEAARHHLALPPLLPTLNRPCFSWISFDPHLWTDLLSSSPFTPHSREQCIFWGADLSRDALDLTQRHLNQATIPSSFYQLHHQPVSDLSSLLQEPKFQSTSLRSTGYIVANPPYGIRVSSVNQARQTWLSLLNQFKSFPETWTLGIILPLKSPPPKYGLKRELVSRFKHGGLDVGWWKFTHS